MGLWQVVFGMECVYREGYWSLIGLIEVRSCVCLVKTLLFVSVYFCCLCEFVRWAISRELHATLTLDFLKFTLLLSL